jgi:2-hydroxy-3-keto-5-methylthiopentenyl-1-phosphate phosphatase
MTISSVLVDFDGTACSVDVASALCARFAAEGWRELDRAVERGELTLRTAIDAQTPMLLASHEQLLGFALSNFAVAPSFLDLVSWAREVDIPVVIVSDGFGFYIEPMLAAAGLESVRVLANQLVEDVHGRRLLHPHANPDCDACGTCKMQAVLDYQRRLGEVAFVGEGASDRYAATYADMVFAKDRLVGICRRDGIGYAPWSTFDDVRETLLTRSDPTRKGVTPRRCPGWHPVSRANAPANTPGEVSNG